jgi:hypothetical protein
LLLQLVRRRSKQQSSRTTVGSAEKPARHLLQSSDCSHKVTECSVANLRSVIRMMISVSFMVSASARICAARSCQCCGSHVTRPGICPLDRRFATERSVTLWEQSELLQEVLCRLFPAAHHRALRRSTAHHTQHRQAGESWTFATL